MPARLKGQEREAEIRRKLARGLEAMKLRVQRMNAEQQAKHKGAIEEWLKAADGWLEGQVDRYPGRPLFLK